MARTKNPAVRSMLIERAALMIREREPVTLRGLVRGTEVSTMAVYTYFDGMDGLWRAVRQEGFTRLAARLAEVPDTADATLERLVRAADAARVAGRFREDVDPLELATQSWAIGHGVAALVATGPLPPAALGHGIPLLTALFVAAGDEPARCARSVAAGWQLS